MITIDEEDFGIGLPSLPPQLEEETPWGLQELLDNAPPWQEGMAPEFASLLRSHPVLRSALMHTRHYVRAADMGLRTADEINQVKLLQGQIAGLQAYTQELVGAALATESPQEDIEDVEE